MNIVFMGTPEIAKTVLQAVLEEGKTNDAIRVRAVFTQPDKPVGRKQILTKPPVKVLAEEWGIPVYQPKRIKREKWVALLKEMQPDLILVAAFGQILSKEILDIPRFGCINLHTSLLPRYRGAAPIQWAIVNGETKTGVTVMQMDPGMDTGDILWQEEVDITASETADTLYDKLSRKAADMAVQTILRLENGDHFTPLKQKEEDATYAPIIQKENGEIDWSSGAEKVDAMVRGFIGWPGAYTYLGGKKMTVLEARVVSGEDLVAKGLMDPESFDSMEDGAIVSAAAALKHPRLIVRSKDRFLEILRLQMEGKKPMDQGSFLRGMKELPPTFDREV